MSFKKNKIIVCLITVFLSACSSNTRIPSIDEMSGEIKLNDRYTLSDRYIDHRAQQSIVATQAGKIAYLDYGQGPTIVMLHGVPSSSWLYRKMIEPLQNDFRVIAIDLLGFGSSDKPDSNDTNYLPSSQAHYVEQVLNQLGVKNYSLLFHDMGGLVAWELLDRDLKKTNNSIENMLILNTIVDQHGFNHPKQKKGVTTRLISDAFANQISSAAVLELTFDNMGLTSNAKLSENECNGYVVPMKEGNGDVLYEFYTSFDEHRFSKLKRQVANLSKLDGGVLVMWGAEDKVLTTEQIPVLQKVAKLDQSNIHIFKDNAHFLPEEIPLKLSNIIHRFLQN